MHRTLHWVMFGLIAANYTVGWTMPSIHGCETGVGDPPPTPPKSLGPDGKIFSCAFIGA